MLRSMGGERALRCQPPQAHSILQGMHRVPPCGRTRAKGQGAQGAPPRALPARAPCLTGALTPLGRLSGRTPDQTTMGVWQASWVLGAPRMGMTIAADRCHADASGHSSVVRE